jgi:hypothetical protein
MRASTILGGLCGFGILLSLLMSAIAPNVWLIFCTLFFNFALAVVVLVSLFLGLVRWRKSSKWWFAPTLFCILFWFGIIVSGRSGIFEFAADWRFRNHIDQYKTIVQAVEDGDIASGETIAPITPPQLPPGTQVVRAARCHDGSMLVEFLDNGSSFAGHAGFVFKNYPGTGNCIVRGAAREQSWRLRQLAENWYRFSE